MAKRKITQLAEDYGKSFEELYELAVNNFEEDMLSGRGRNTWVDERGQDLLDDMIAMPLEDCGKVYRGKVLSECPNKHYVMVHHRDRSCKVPVKINKRMIGKLLGKVIYFEENGDEDNRTYTWVKR